MSNFGLSSATSFNLAQMCFFALIFMLFNQTNRSRTALLKPEYVIDKKSAIGVQK